MLKRDKLLFILVAVVIMIFSVPVYADEITDSINDALKSYQDGKYSEAMNSLNYASQLIGQKKGGDLVSFLPEPLKEWTAEEAVSNAAGTQMFGGGITAERSYNKDPSSVYVKIITDSPMLQGLMIMISNPMMAASDGGKLEKISGEKAVVKYNAEDKNGDINIVVANRFLVTVEGSDVSLEDLKAYAGAVDYKKLAELP